MTIEDFNNKLTPEQRLGVYACLLLYFQYFNRSGEGVMGETSPINERIKMFTIREYIILTSLVRIRDLELLRENMLLEAKETPTNEELFLIDKNRHLCAELRVLLHKLCDLEEHTRHVAVRG